VSSHLLDTACRTVDKIETQVLPSLSLVVPSGASRHCSELPGSSPIPCHSLCQNTSPRQRVLSSVGITQLHRYYDPIRHLNGPTPYLTIPLLARSLTQPPKETSRVALISRVQACCHHYLGGTVECICRSPSSTTATFPVCTAGRLPHYNFRGLLGVHTTLRPACSLNSLRVLLPKASTNLLSIAWILPTGTTLVGQGFHLLRIGTFARRKCNLLLDLICVQATITLRIKYEIK